MFAGFYRTLLGAHTEQLPPENCAQQVSGQPCLLGYVAGRPGVKGAGGQPVRLLHMDGTLSLSDPSLPLPSSPPDCLCSTSAIWWGRCCRVCAS